MQGGYVENVSVDVKTIYGETAHVTVDFCVSRLVLGRFVDALIPVGDDRCEPVMAILEHSIQEDQ